MVSTRHAERMHKAAEESPPPADSGDEYEEPSPEPNRTRVTKRARTGAATAKDKQQEKRSAKAKLWMLPEMPIDVLYEVGTPLWHHIFIYTKVFPDLFPRPPKRPLAYFLDGEHPQRVPHQQVIATCLAGLVQDDPGERAGATMPLRDNRNGICEPFVRPTLHGLCTDCQCYLPPTNWLLQNCAGYRSLTSHWTVLMRICRPCVEEMYFLLPLPAPFWHSMILPRAINLDEARPDALASKVIRYIGEVLPTFYIKRAYAPLYSSLLRKSDDLQKRTDRLRWFSSRTRRDSSRNSQLQGEFPSRTYSRSTSCAFEKGSKSVTIRLPQFALAHLFSTVLEFYVTLDVEVGKRRRKGKRRRAGRYPEAKN